MITLYESILASTNTGKTSYEKYSIPHISKQLKGDSIYTYYDVDIDMKMWFQVVSEENFHSVFDKPIQELRKLCGKRYTEDTKKIGLFFNDGYLEVKLEQSPHNKNISYNWYFADEPRKHFEEKNVAYRINWATLKEKTKTNQGWNWFAPTYSRKEGIEKIHKFMKEYIKYTPKQ